MNLIIIFLTGLTVGGLTCLAVQGGLLASVITARENEGKDRNNKQRALYATGSFLAAKLIAYTILGFILGAFGSSLNVGNNIQIFMQLLAGIYMLLVALNLLDVHPIFRYVIIQPPRLLTRLVKNQSKSKDVFAPALLGIMTIFIPCGTTIAMEALAISSANALTGGIIMAVFILGTAPLFLGTGFITSILGETFKTKFFKVAAIILIYLGLTSINGALIALGSPLSFSTITDNFQANDKKSYEKLYNEIPTNQNIIIEITSRGYSPNYIKVKKGSPVILKVINKDAYSCASAFRIPSLGVSVNLQPNQEETITFTPQEVGKIPFSCSMGMYRGVIEVI